MNYMTPVISKTGILLMSFGANINSYVSNHEHVVLSAMPAPHLVHLGTSTSRQAHPGTSIPGHRGTPVPPKSGSGGPGEVGKQQALFSSTPSSSPSSSSPSSSLSYSSSSSSVQLQAPDTLDNSEHNDDREPAQLWWFGVMVGQWIKVDTWNKINFFCF